MWDWIDWDWAGLQWFCGDGSGADEAVFVGSPPREGRLGQPISGSRGTADGAATSERIGNLYKPSRLPPRSTRAEGNYLI
jgi:hypothetical protein